MAFGQAFQQAFIYLASAVLAVLIGKRLGLGAVAVGLILAMSSTAIVLQSLKEKGLLPCKGLLLELFFLGVGMAVGRATVAIAAFPMATTPLLFLAAERATSYGPDRANADRASGAEDE